jgi:hypothetical protein
MGEVRLIERIFGLCGPDGGSLSAKRGALNFL